MCKQAWTTKPSPHTTWVGFTILQEPNQSNLRSAFCPSIQSFHLILALRRNGRNEGLNAFSNPPLIKNRASTELRGYHPKNKAGTDEYVATVIPHSLGIPSIKQQNKPYIHSHNSVHYHFLHYATVAVASPIPIS